MINIHRAYGEDIPSGPFYPGEILGQIIPSDRVCIGDIVTWTKVNFSRNVYVFDPEVKIEGIRFKAIPKEDGDWYWEDFEDES